MPRGVGAQGSTRDVLRFSASVRDPSVGASGNHEMRSGQKLGAAVSLLTGSGRVALPACPALLAVIARSLRQLRPRSPKASPCSRIQAGLQSRQALTAWTAY